MEDPLAAITFTQFVVHWALPSPGFSSQQSDVRDRLDPAKGEPARLHSTRVHQHNMIQLGTYVSIKETEEHVLILAIPRCRTAICTIKDHVALQASLTRANCHFALVIPRDRWAFNAWKLQRAKRGLRDHIHAASNVRLDTRSNLDGFPLVATDLNRSKRNEIAETAILDKLSTAVEFSLEKAKGYDLQNALIQVCGGEYKALKRQRSPAALIHLNSESCPDTIDNTVTSRKFVTSTS